MQRFLIKLANGLLLVVVLIGIPDITRARFGELQISSVPKAQLLTFWGLALVAIANAVAALMLLKGRKERMLCWEWAAVFGGLLLAYYGFTRGYFNFNWLKQTLLWLQRHF